MGLDVAIDLTLAQRQTILKLGEHCLKIGSGATPRGGKEVYLATGPFALIRSQNVLKNRFSDNGLAYISEEQAKQLSNVKVMVDDVLLNITGDSVARVCQVEPSILPAHVNQHVAIIRPEPTVIDPSFLRYFLASPQMQEHMLAFAASGATRNALTKEMIKNFEIPAIPISEQRTIADTLSAFDDRIELNQRMNETLEAMAQTLFKDWFVDFGPTRAKMEGRASYLASEIWDLFPDRLDKDGKPEGWETRRIDQLLELAYGKALRISDRKLGSVPVYGSGGIIGNHSAHLVDGPSVIVGRKGTVGSLYWEDRPFFPIDTVFYIHPHAPLTFCYYTLGQLALDQMNTDAAVPGLNRNNVYRLMIPWSGEKLISVFDQFASSIRYGIKHNVTESRTLAQIRDLLLPKMMSGEITVKRAEKIMES